jgi:hypothetical protein
MAQWLTIEQSDRKRRGLDRSCAYLLGKHHFFDYEDSPRNRALSKIGYDDSVRSLHHGCRKDSHPFRGFLILRDQVVSMAPSIHANDRTAATRVMMKTKQGRIRIEVPLNQSSR